MNPVRDLTLLFTAAGISLAVHGADDRVVQVTQITQTAEAVAKHPAPVVEDLGDIRPLADKPLLLKMRFTTSLRGEFVSNAKSIGNHGSGDFLLVPAINAALDQPLGHGFALSLNARAESFLYSRFNNFSFWGFSGMASVSYQPSENSPRIYAGIEPYWFASVNSGRQLAEALGISTGVEKEWAINRDQTILFAGYNFSSFVSSPARDDRDSHRATVGITQQILPSLLGQLYYSYQFSDYTSVARHDSRNLVGLSLVYQFNEHWSGNATTYFVDNNSSMSLASYQTFGIGLGLALHF